MIGGLAVILGCQVVGEVVVRLLGLPIPGPVVGLVLFFCYLSWRRPPDTAATVTVAERLIRYLPIMFVPTTVGWIVYGPAVASQWLPAAVASFGTWLATIVLVGWVATLLRPRRTPGPAAEVDA